ncbi:SMP-30/gluconolactonase/LRE family protein [Cryobacterium lactosi]|uniref:SMP-30/gluconolactonase/LRE family protein n=1 Tax=Cryobacterium lactosi TaxID=1259202 RepID=A0A4R9BGR2_9MICO|nr:SMP-30/gluconolactonase/LRE family protein [Cryobacterium lactosi]TFD84019.1 SMP-30/gluconolactonase/LRE family protein [Cryobacterium lactosi]
MTEYHAHPQAGQRHVLGEGPVWVSETSTLIWVDVERGTVFEGTLVEGVVEPIRQLDFDGRVGAAVPSEDGDILVATENRLLVVTPDGKRLNGPVIVAPGVASRANDGACDPAGRVLIGTLALDGREGEETLHRLETDGSLTVVDSDLTLSNGIAWSPDGALMYSTDTAPGIIWVRDYNVESGEIGPRRQHLHIEAGYPDGICTDAQGNLWVAIWGEGEVRSFDPSGRHTDTVFVNAPHVSSVAFVGDELDTLLITTASRDLDGPDLLTYPDAGRLFLADVGATGMPSTRWVFAGTRAAVH